MDQLLGFIVVAGAAFIAGVICEYVAAAIHHDHDHHHHPKGR